MKFNLGAGEQPLDGWQNLDLKTGHTIYPLPVADGSADEIRASHVLEHFPRADVVAVVTDWVRALKPGGTLRLAVPDFRKVAEDYLAGKPGNPQGYIMGGQVDAADYHKTLFDRDDLRAVMAAAGLVLLRDWRSEIQDCASLPVSLNLAGTKPHKSSIKVGAAMSTPRLGFMDNFFSAVEALPPLGIALRKVTGAFWGPNLQWCLEEIVADPSIEAVMTLDYDSIFTRKHAATLLELALCHPEADCIVPVQSNRHKASPLFTLPGVRAVTGAYDEMISVERDVFAGDLVPVKTAHFGLTLIRADKLRALPKPWFLGTPNGEGRWDDGKIDEDIHFWREWEKAGNNLMLAPKVVIGHAELMVRWPDDGMAAKWQPMSEWNETKQPPAGTWTGA